MTLLLIRRDIDIYFIEIDCDLCVDLKISKVLVNDDEVFRNLYVTSVVIGLNILKRGDKVSVDVRIVESKNWEVFNLIEFRVVGS